MDSFPFKKTGICICHLVDSVEVQICICNYFLNCENSLSWTAGPPKKNTHTNQSTICTNSFRTIWTNCPPFLFKISRKQAHRVCANCFYLGVFGGWVAFPWFWNSFGGDGCSGQEIRSLGTTPISGKTLSEWKGHSRSSQRVPGYSRSGISEQLSEFEIPFSEYEIPFSEWHPTTWAIQKPEFSEQLPERFPELMGTRMKDFHLPWHSRSVFSRIGVVPARQKKRWIRMAKPKSATPPVEPALPPPPLSLQPSESGIWTEQTRASFKGFWTRWRVGVLQGPKM